jgi:hypothetical protein
VTAKIVNRASKGTRTCRRLAESLNLLIEKNGMFLMDILAHGDYLLGLELSLWLLLGRLPFLS